MGDKPDVLLEALIGLARDEIVPSAAEVAVVDDDRFADCGEDGGDLSEVSGSTPAPWYSLHGVPADDVERSARERLLNNALAVIDELAGVTTEPT